MASHDYGLLDQATEGMLSPSLTGREHSADSPIDALHKERLLKVEVRPFDRVARKILARDSLLYNPPLSLPTPPPDGSAIDQDAAAQQSLLAKQAEDRRQWRDEMLLDFAALEDSMVRIQLLRRSNEAERQRYAAEKVKILDTAQAIRDNTVLLRSQLVEAQKTLALRKTYDELADKITSNRMLKPRAEQATNLAKLEKEIRDLEAESREYAQTWAERRQQFGRIVDEGKQMLRMIRDEKEEAERKEGMEENSEAGGSRAGTPTPGDGGRTPAHPSQEGGSTPLRPLPKDLLAVEGASGRNSRASSPQQSLVAATPGETANSPRGSMAEQAEVKVASPVETGEDTEMGEAGDLEDLPANQSSEGPGTAMDTSAHDADEPATPKAEEMGPGEEEADQAQQAEGKEARGATQGQSGRPDHLVTEMEVT